MEARDRLSEILQRPEASDALARLLEIAVKLEESGVLDLLEALADDKVIASLSRLILTTGTLRALDRLDEILDTIGRAAEAIVEPAEPVGLTGLLKALSDPRVQKGLGRLLNILKILGEE